jgi:predicted outer membrane repeat protein
MNKFIAYYIVIICCSQLSYASDIYVNALQGDDDWDGSSPTFIGGIQGPKATIQAAIDVSIENDTVIVAPGAYEGAGNRDIDFQGLAITLRSENGPETCIINCNGSELDSHRAFYFHTAEDADSIIDGFTITNGYAWGAGINCLDSSPTIRNCIFQDNSTNSKGAAIAFDQSDSLIQNCTFAFNNADEGGAIYATQSQLSIDACSFQYNATTGSAPFGRGGAICLEDDSQITLTDSTIKNNVSATFGGAIFCKDSEVIIVNSLIKGNWAESFGGAIYANFSQLAITNCTYSGNVSQFRGGAIHTFDTTNVTIYNSIFWGDSVFDPTGVGPEFSLGTGATLNIFNSTVQGGLVSLYLEGGAILNWDNTVITQDPIFAEPGYWDPNDTPDNSNDDSWIDGDFRLLTNSPCINFGNNAAIAGYDTDFRGFNRIIDTSVDLGPYENGLTVEKFIVKAGKIRDADLDSFKISGRFDAAESDLATTQLYFQLGPYEETVNFNADNFKKAGKKPKYTYKGTTGALKSMKFDLTKHTFSLIAQKIDLSGFASPAPVRISVGDFDGLTMAGEDVINGSKKPAPMKLLLGQADGLRVDKFKNMVNPGANQDLLQVQGGIAVQDTLVDLANEDVYIYWGTYVMHIPAGSGGFTQKGTKKSYLFKLPKGDTDPTTAMMVVDLEKCTFKLLVKSATIGQQTNPVKFRMTFDSYDETVLVTQE